MLLKNEYTKIKEANDLSLKTLRGENRATINDLGKRLEAPTWNCYEIERIKKDLIDMAARCELEGRTLEQEVGGDTDAFFTGTGRRSSSRDAAGFRLHLVPSVDALYGRAQCSGASAAEQYGSPTDPRCEFPLSLADLAVHSGLVPAHRTKNQDSLWPRVPNPMVYFDAGNLCSFLHSAKQLFPNHSRHYKLRVRHCLRIGVGRWVPVLADFPLQSLGCPASLAGTAP